MTIHNQAYLENPFCLAFEQTKAELHEKWEARKPGDKKAEATLRKEWDEEMAQALADLKTALASQELGILEGFNDKSQWFEDVVPLTSRTGFDASTRADFFSPPTVDESHGGARP